MVIITRWIDSWGICFRFCPQVNPTNPTGDYMPINEMMSYIEEQCQPGSTVIVDESMQLWLGPHWREDSLIGQVSPPPVPLSLAVPRVFPLASLALSRFFGVASKGGANSGSLRPQQVGSRGGPSAPLLQLSCPSLVVGPDRSRWGCGVQAVRTGFDYVLLGGRATGYVR